MAKPFFDKYKDTSRRKENFNSLYIETCNLSRESLACLLGVMGANGTGLVNLYLKGFTGNLEPVHLEGLEGVTELAIYDVGERFYCHIFCATVVCLWCQFESTIFLFNSSKRWQCPFKQEQLNSTPLNENQVIISVIDHRTASVRKL